MAHKFITLEGIEGAGKSTVISFIADFLRQHNIAYILAREPGGTEIAEKIRQVILAHYHEAMHPDTELLLYFASRAQNLNQIILPALRNKQWVICDRYTDASYAYQCGGRGLPQEKIALLENFVQGDLRPDYTIFLDVAVKTGLARIKKNRVLDRFEVEKEEFFEKVRNHYLMRAQNEPKRFRVVDANLTPTEVKQQLQKILEDMVGQSK